MAKNNDISVVNTNNYLIPLTKKVFGEVTVSDIKQSNLNSFDKEVCLACFSLEKIKVMDAEDAGTILQGIINRTIFECGMGVQDIALMTQIIIKDIFRDYSFMTTEEVAIAFRMGVREEWGELKGMNIRQFYVWLRKYNQQIKKDAISCLQFTIKPKNIIPNEDEKIKIKRSWLKSWCATYDEWLSGKDVLFVDANNIFYNYCYDNKILVLTIKEKEELYKQAELLFRLKLSPKNAKSKSERADFEGTLKKLQKGDNAVKNSVKSEAKNLSIKRLFSNLKASKKTLSQVISAIENRD